MLTHFAARIGGPVLIVAALGTPVEASATPLTRVEVQPSAILIFATNTEDKPYSCTINMVWSHDSFGERKRQNVSTTTNVAANAKDAVIYRMAGALVNVQIDSGPTISCT